MGKTRAECSQNAYTSAFLSHWIKILANSSPKSDIFKKKKNTTLFFRILRSVGRGQHNKKKNWPYVYVRINDLFARLLQVVSEVGHVRPCTRISLPRVFSGLARHHRLHPIVKHLPWENPVYATDSRSYFAIFLRTCSLSLLFLYPYFKSSKWGGVPGGGGGTHPKFGRYVPRQSEKWARAPERAPGRAWNCGAPERAWAVLSLKMRGLRNELGPFQRENASLRNYQDASHWLALWPAANPRRCRTLCVRAEPAVGGDERVKIKEM